ncbi:MAG: hypothetical protein Ct9H300mP23_06700 [Nitrospinota bacterium]|nr:MAG: hypothetical protein Ct9H300mP23_06700 [Nitrospinota bacterium]
MVLDLKALKKLINEEIVSKVDHKNLNVDVDFLEGVYPQQKILQSIFGISLSPRLKVVHCTK